MPIRAGQEILELGRGRSIARWVWWDACVDGRNAGAQDSVEVEDGTLINGASLTMGALPESVGGG